MLSLSLLGRFRAGERDSEFRLRQMQTLTKVPDTRSGGRFVYVCLLSSPTMGERKLHLRTHQVTQNLLNYSKYKEHEY